MDERKSHCKNCGAEIIVASKYCFRCGIRFNNTLSPISGTQVDQPQDLKQSAKDDVKDGLVVRASNAYLDFWENALAPLRFWEKAPAPALALAPAPRELTPSDLALISTHKKNPGVAAVLSFFWAGLGQIYNGQIAKGVALMIVQVINVLLLFVLIGFITYPLVWLIGIVDAYGTAQKHNERLLKGEFS
jgi:TM2 domain-containing membrane protein YozV